MIKVRLEGEDSIGKIILTLTYFNALGSRTKIELTFFTTIGFIKQKAQIIILFILLLISVRVNTTVLTWKKIILNI